MFLSVKLKASLIIFSFATVLVVGCPVLSYSQSMPSPEILPTGVEWNKPLKAGDMVLPTLHKRKKYKYKQPSFSKDKAIKLHSLRPPLLKKRHVKSSVDGSSVLPPKMSDKAKNADSLMLLQGLKSMLETNGEIESKKQIKEIKTDLKPVPLSVSVEDKSNNYVKGQEPKIWVTPKTEKEEIKIKKADDGLMDIIFPSSKKETKLKTIKKVDKIPDVKNVIKPLPDDNDIKKIVDIPKATDLMEKPKLLSDVSDEEIKNKETSFFDKISDPIESIFGSPIDEDERSDIFVEKKKEIKSDCKPTVTSWTKECSSAGYPSHYVGKIVGETRIECPSGDAKDVWLSNNCAAPVASSPIAIQETEKLEIAPVEITKEEKSVFVPSVDSNAIVDASCGSSNGMAFDHEPDSSLCLSGKSTDVFGDGPWRWSCKGLNGGGTVSCAAPVIMTEYGQKVTLAKHISDVEKKLAPVVSAGKCGSSSGKGLNSKPLTDLCLSGKPSPVSGTGPWTWACSGINGGRAEACISPKIINGVCGRSNDRGTEFSPKENLCKSGYASAVNGSGPWYWTCSGSNGGEASTCRALMKTNAICGNATTIGFRKAPEKDLCTIGLASEVTGKGPWEWNCIGANGGGSVACKTEKLSDGACGGAHGKQFVSAPKMSLCTVGRSSRVTGHGPWEWSCAGEKGGITVSCSAFKGKQEEIASSLTCGVSSEIVVLTKPTKDLCRFGNPSDVKGNNPWNWTCNDDAGHSVSCTTLTKADGVCGKAKGEKSDVEPKFGLCDIGSPSKVIAVGKKWSWKCDGVMGGNNVKCLSERVIVKGAADKKPKKKIIAKCGSASGQSFTKKPTKDLCEFGKATRIKGKDSWNWECINKKVKTSCNADKFENAVCGNVNGSILRHAPKSKLCSSGVATSVTGHGPWLWSCVGRGGGSSVSCSAISQSQIHIDGTCGAVANAVMTNAPKANLCDTGKPSKVYGEGPWTWTCSGSNGGIASTCTTIKVLPKAPPPPAPLVNGVCGSSNGVAFVVRPRAGYCSSGTTSAVSGNGPWNWSCLGENGGMTVSCTAPLMPPAPIVGACGVAHGMPSLTKPRSSLCKSGISSAVSGKGPWRWSCSGTNGGGAVSCISPFAGKVKHSSSSSSLKSSKDLSTPKLKVKKLPAMKAGVVPNLKPSRNAPKTKMTAPKAAPYIPVDLHPITIEAKDKGLLSPVIDSEGLIVDGTGMVLDPETSTIYFKRGSDKLDDEAVLIAERIAKIMKNNGIIRITLTAYSDTGGRISPRKARKLSLKRALAIRDFLAVKNIPNGRVDVRPKGANVPSGDMDRVDISIN